MKIVPKVLLVLAIIMIIINVFMMDFDDLSWSVNRSAYMQIIAMTCVVFSMVLRLKNK